MVYLPVGAAEHCRSEAALYIQVSLTGTLRFTRPTCDCEDVGWVKKQSDIPVIIQGAPQRKPFALEKRSYKGIAGRRVLKLFINLHQKRRQKKKICGECKTNGNGRQQSHIGIQLEVRLAQHHEPGNQH